MKIDPDKNGFLLTAETTLEQQILAGWGKLKPAVESHWIFDRCETSPQLRMTFQPTPDDISRFTEALKQ